MQHACVGLYTVKPGTVDEVIYRATVDLAPMYRYQRGFVAFGLDKTCGDALIALSVWNRAEQAEAAIHTATIWQQQHVAAMVDGVENRVGVVPFFWEPVAIGR